MLVRADASSAIGSGHVMRCLALAKAWQHAGGGACFLTAESIGALDERFAQEDVRHERIAVQPGTPDDAEQTVALVRRLGTSWVVVDGYRFKPDYIHQLKMSGARVLALDDDVRFDYYEADVVLNQNIDARAESYKREGSTHLLLGAKYVLLRPEFLAEQPRGEIARVARRLLVTMGGSDPENVASTVMRALARLEADFEVTVVAGGGNPHYESLQELVKRLPGKVQLERSSVNMAAIMRWADVAISAAGGTCWELAYLGVPMILITASRDQEENASAISKTGAALSLGWHANLSEDDILEAIKKVMNDPEGRGAMSKSGRALVDGKGAARVVEFLQSCV